LNISTTGNGCPAASCAGNTFTLTNKTPGAVGNVGITTTVTSTTFTGGLTGMSGGKAEDCATGVGCTQHDDCASDVCSLDQTCAGGGATCTAGCGTNPPTCFQCTVGATCKVNIDCAPPVATPTTTSGVCDATGTGTCVSAERLQVVVTGGGTLSSSSPPGTLDTGDITSCTSGGGACLQSYSANATVNLTATT